MIVRTAATHVSTTDADAAEAAAAALAAATAEAAPAHFVALHAGAGCDLAALSAAAARAFPGAALHGGTSCLGAMTGAGFVAAGEGVAAGVGCFVLHDPDGDYATAAEPMGDDPRTAARRAAERALAEAGRAGETPDLVWLSASPGREEAVLEGIAEAVGRRTPVFGGSVADDAVAGGWRVLGAEGPMEEAVRVSVLFPSRPLGLAFQSGYAPAGRAGQVTRAEGRRVLEIDGRPARDVYAEWTEGEVDARGAAAPTPILSASTLHPLGREVGEVSGVPFHLLAHPATACPDGAIELFADVAEGEELRLMTGSADSLVARAGRVARQACAVRGVDAAAPVGALVVYCGGCMLAVRERMAEVVAGVDAALDGAPFLGVFTFGEQGEAADGRNRHGNLMISCVAFGP